MVWHALLYWGYLVVLLLLEIFDCIIIIEEMWLHYYHWGDVVALLLLGIFRGIVIIEEMWSCNII